MQSKCSIANHTNKLSYTRTKQWKILTKTLIICRQHTFPIPSMYGNHSYDQFQRFFNNFYRASLQSRIIFSTTLQTVFSGLTDQNCLLYITFLKADIPKLT